MKFAWSNYYDHNHIPYKHKARSKSTISSKPNSSTNSGLYINNSLSKTIKNYVNSKLHASPFTSIKDNESISNNNSNTINISSNLFWSPKVNEKEISDLGLLKATNLKLTQLLAETKLRYQEKQAQLEQLYKELNITNKITYSDLTNNKNGRKPIHLNIKLQNECKPRLHNNNNNNNHSHTINTISLTDDNIDSNKR